MAGVTGLEPATSGVTGQRPCIAYKVETPVFWVFLTSALS